MKRTFWIVGGVVLLVVGLAGVALAAGPMQGLTPSLEAAPGTQVLSSESALTVDAGNGGMAASASAIEIKPAAEQPQSAPDAMGVFSRRDNNSLFVSSFGQGIVSSSGQTIVVQAGGSDGQAFDGQAVVVQTVEGAAPGDGQAEELEVVVTNDTKVWEDVTSQSLGNGPSSGVTSFEQELKPGSADAIGKNAMVLAWGEKRGDQLIASVLIYSNPFAVINGQ